MNINNLQKGYMEIYAPQKRRKFLKQVATAILMTIIASAVITGIWFIFSVIILLGQG